MLCGDPGTLDWMFISVAAMLKQLYVLNCSVLKISVRVLRAAGEGCAVGDGGPAVLTCLLFLNKQSLVMYCIRASCCRRRMRCG
jgi:hypothetical protein